MVACCGAQNVGGVQIRRPNYEKFLPVERCQRATSTR
jgi:hypothetical protein